MCFKDKLGPLPPEAFDNDFPSMPAPPKGVNPLVDALRDHVALHKLTDRERRLVLDVIAQHPGLSVEEAIKHLRAFGM